jgi:hypothetical protein
MNTDEIDAAFVVEISREDVEGINLEPFINTMAPYVANPKPFHMGAFFFLVDGYNDTPDEAYAIPAVRDYWQAMDARWPYTIFFANAKPELGCNIVNVIFSILKNITAATKGTEASTVEFCQSEVIEYFLQRKMPLIELNNKAYPDFLEATNAILKRTHELLEAFGLEKNN